MQIQMTGIAWYTEKAFYTLREQFEDKANISEKYEEWLADASALFQKIENDKISVVKIFLEPDIFIEWCKKNKMKLDSKARMRYANEGALAILKNQET